MTEASHPKPPFPLEFFQGLRAARPRFDLVDQGVIPLEERGKAIVVKKGQSVRVICVEGPQVPNICIWNADNYDERFWNEFTSSREGLFLTAFSRLWSNMPRLRPMMTIIEDTVRTKPTFAMEQHHFASEGGAVGIAALLRDEPSALGQHITAVISGGNTGIQQIWKIMEKRWG